MAAHEYTARQALEVLLQRVAARDAQLASEIQSAIDAGRDVEERELEPVRGRRRKPRSYRKTMPFTDEQALQIAVSVLQAHFVEQPLFVRSATQQFQAAGIGQPEEQWRWWPPEGQSQPLIEGVGVPKALEVELQTETQLVKSGEPTISLGSLSDESISEQREHMAKLLQLVDFNGR
jgi:hypothetical protein